MGEAGPDPDAGYFFGTTVPALFFLERVFMLESGEVVNERVDGPLNNGEDVLDSRYTDGSWDTLTVLRCIGVNALTLIGNAADPMMLTRRDGEFVDQYEVQGGMYLMSRTESNNFTMIMGGGP